MSRNFAYSYAARLNAFKIGARGTGPGGTVTTQDMLARAASVEGLNAVDLNYPDHVVGSEADLKGRLAGLGLALNGFAMRYYGEPAYRLGAFTNPDPAIRRAAIDLTKRGVDAMSAAGGKVMTIWLGQDGVDYSFQGDYSAMWDHTVEALREVASHDPAVAVSIEYKPNEPRSFSLLPDAATTLLAVADTGCRNVGVTLDFAHVLFADEIPAFAATLIAKRAVLHGVHLNDGWGKRDDGLMVGAVHPVQTVELLWTLERIGYDGVIYFDTFPDHTGLDPVRECAANIASVEALRAVAGRLKGDTALEAAMARQDAVASHVIVQRALYGREG
jgi:xylose isomerase